MRAITAFVLPLAVAFSAACEGDHSAPLGPNAGPQAMRGTSHQNVPFKTSSYVTHLVASAPEPGCDGPGEARVYSVGGGTATHLGRYTITLSFCGHAEPILTDGRGTFVAANGDLLDFTFEGTSQFIPPVFVRFASCATFVGGTGRFANANGKALVTGTLDITKVDNAAQWDGTLYAHEPAAC